MSVQEGLRERVREANDIVEVVGSYLTLNKAGDSYRTLCPFHKEKTPSFNVNSGRQSFHCFGCGAGGDVFKFVQLYEGCEFPDAIRILAKRAGIPFEPTAESGIKLDPLYLVLNTATTYYHELLMEHIGNLESRFGKQISEESSIVRQYVFEKRKLTQETVEQFKLGYAPNGWRTTHDALRSILRGDF